MAKSRGPVTVQPKSDVYTGLLAISLGAMVIGSALLFLDFTQYGQKKPEPLPTPGAIKSPQPK